MRRPTVIEDLAFNGSVKDGVTDGSSDQNEGRVGRQLDLFEETPERPSIVGEAGARSMQFWHQRTIEALWEDVSQVMFASLDGDESQSGRS